MLLEEDKKVKTTKMCQEIQCLLTLPQVWVTCWNLGNEIFFVSKKEGPFEPFFLKEQNSEILFEGPFIDSTAKEKTGRFKKHWLI